MIFTGPTRISAANNQSGGLIFALRRIEDQKCRVPKVYQGGYFPIRPD